MDSIRRFLAAGVVLAVLLSLLPFVPWAYGYNTAVVRSSNQSVAPAASTTPGTRFITCEQHPGTFVIKQSTALESSLLRVRCQNNWVAPVNVQLAVGNPNGSGISFTADPSGDIPPGGAACIDVYATGPAKGSTSYTVAYQGTVTTSALMASFRFTGVFRWQNGTAKNNITCTP